MGSRYGSIHQYLQPKPGPKKPVLHSYSEEEDDEIPGPPPHLATLQLSRVLGPPERKPENKEPLKPSNSGLPSLDAFKFYGSMPPTRKFGLSARPGTGTAENAAPSQLKEGEAVETRQPSRARAAPSGALDLQPARTRKRVRPSHVLGESSSDDEKSRQGPTAPPQVGKRKLALTLSSDDEHDGPSPARGAHGKGKKVTGQPAVAREVAVGEGRDAGEGRDVTNSLPVADMSDSLFAEKVAEMEAEAAEAVVGPGASRLVPGLVVEPRAAGARAQPRAAGERIEVARPPETDAAVPIEVGDDEEEWEEEEDDPVAVALAKSEEVSAGLRRELGLADSAVDRVADVDGGGVRAKLITQAEVRAACGLGEERELKAYQLVGVNYLLLLHQQGVPGAILGDEMGLGKTVQAIVYVAMLTAQRETRGGGGGVSGPTLVVAPSSVLDNWEREVRAWAPRLRVLKFHGDGRRDSREALENAARAGEEPPFDVLLCTYSLFERESAVQKSDRKCLKRWHWGCVVMDEAHLLKDRGSARARHLRSITHGATRRLMLSGTPLQNDLQELWALLELLLPDVFAECAQLLPACRALGEEQGEAQLVARVKTILAPFFLRRIKADVMTQLAPKKQEVLHVEMSPEQSSAYEAAVQAWRSSVAARGSDVSAFSRRQVVNIFTDLRKLANHPLLVRRCYSDAAVSAIAEEAWRSGEFGTECSLERVVQEVAGMSDMAIHQLCLSSDRLVERRLKSKDVMAAAKMQALSTLLPQLQQESHRVLIFSQWTSVLDILEWGLDVMGFSYTRLDGSTAVSTRQGLVDEFNRGGPDAPFLFLLSTRAGGQGLNLTGADTVIIHDCDFNPQVDRQAEDRAHRLGQTRPVTIYRLVTRATVDEGVLRTATRKLSLDAAILEDKGEGEAQSAAQLLAELLATPAATA